MHLIDAIPAVMVFRVKNAKIYINKNVFITSASYKFACMFTIMALVYKVIWVAMVTILAGKRVVAWLQNFSYTP